MLFTEPKTAAHLLIPVLNSLTGKRVFWAKKLQNQAEFSPMQNLDLADPGSFYFALDRPPWARALMERVWNTNEKRGLSSTCTPPIRPLWKNIYSKKNV